MDDLMPLYPPRPEYTFAVLPGAPRPSDRSAATRVLRNVYYHGRLLYPIALNLHIQVLWGPRDAYGPRVYRAALMARHPGEEDRFTKIKGEVSRTVDEALEALEREVVEVVGEYPVGGLPIEVLEARLWGGC